MVDPVVMTTVTLDYATVEIRNAAVSDEARYDCEILHPVYGWIPFTADPNDPEVSARQVYYRIVSPSP